MPKEYKRIQDSQISRDQLMDVLEYDASSGVFTWKVSSKSTISPGDVAGSPSGSGYIKIAVFGKRYYAHRLAWFYVSGYWPNEIDHINGERHDNRISNLRDCKHSENCQNAGLSSINKTGFPGVYAVGKLYAAQITFNYKTKKLGLFKTKEDAYSAYCRSKSLLHKFQPSTRLRAA